MLILRTLSSVPVPVIVSCCFVLYPGHLTLVKQEELAVASPSPSPCPHQGGAAFPHTEELLELPYLILTVWGKDELK